MHKYCIVSIQLCEMLLYTPNLGFLSWVVAYSVGFFCTGPRAGNWWKSPPVTEPQFTTGNRFRLWLIIAIRNLPDARNNRHKPNRTVSGAIIITNGL